MVPPAEAEQIRARLGQWARAQERMDRLRAERRERTDTVKAITSFDGLFEYAILHTPKRMTSGLVEQQALFWTTQK